MIDPNWSWIDVDESHAFQDTAITFTVRSPATTFDFLVQYCPDCRLVAVQCHRMVKHRDEVVDIAALQEANDAAFGRMFASLCTWLTEHYPEHAQDADLAEWRRILEVLT